MPAAWELVAVAARIPVRHVGTPRTAGRMRRTHLLHCHAIRERVHAREGHALPARQRLRHGVGAGGLHANDLHAGGARARASITP